MVFRSLEWSLVEKMMRAIVVPSKWAYFIAKYSVISTKSVKFPLNGARLLAGFTPRSSFSHTRPILTSRFSKVQIFIIKNFLNGPLAYFFSFGFVDIVDIFDGINRNQA